MAEFKQSAFPAHPTFDEEGNILQQASNGMTLRDYFAGQAMISACEDWNPEECAKLAYEWADAMIAERNKE